MDTLLELTAKVYISQIRWPFVIWVKWISNVPFVVYKQNFLIIFYIKAASTASKTSDTKNYVLIFKLSQQSCLLGFTRENTMKKNRSP